MHVSLTQVYTAPEVEVYEFISVHDSICVASCNLPEVEEVEFEF